MQATIGTTPCASFSASPPMLGFWRLNGEMKRPPCWYSWMMKERIKQLKDAVEAKRQENERLAKKLAIIQRKVGTQGTRKPTLHHPPAHMRAKSDIGTLQDLHIDIRQLSSHRALGTKFNLLLGQRMTPDDSKANSARNHVFDLPGSASGSVSGKLKKLLASRQQTHKRKWLLAAPKKESGNQERMGSERRIVHIRRDLGNFKRENPHLVGSQMFGAGALQSSSHPKLDLITGAPQAPILTAKKLLAVRHNLAHHLDAVRDARFLSEDQLVSCSEDFTVALWDIQLKRDKQCLPFQVLRGHLAPVLTVDKENYDTTARTFYSAAADGNLKVWRSSLDPAKGRSAKFEQVASIRVSSEPVWEVASSPFAVTLTDKASICHIKL